MIIYQKFQSYQFTADEEKFIRHALNKAKKIGPNICSNGGKRVWGETEDLEATFQIHSFLAGIIASRDWILGQKTRKTINTGRSSYRYKHIVEDWADHYVCNGAFIVASVGIGLKSELGELNPCFNRAPETYRTTTPTLFGGEFKQLLSSFNIFATLHTVPSLIRDGTTLIAQGGINSNCICQGNVATIVINPAIARLIVYGASGESI